MSITITSEDAILVNTAGRAHFTGWVRVDGGIAPGTTRREMRGRKCVHITEQTGPLIQTDTSRAALTLDRFRELTGWAPPRGRPSEGKTDRLHVRLPPDLKAKVEERGGSAWVLELIRSAP